VTLPSGQIHFVEDNQLNAFIEEHDSFDAPVQYELLPPAPDSIWQSLLPMTPLRRDTLHVFETKHGELMNASKQTAPVTHLMFFGVPDGGVHRLGVYTEM
jgi:allantoicase